MVLTEKNIKYFLTRFAFPTNTTSLERRCLEKLEKKFENATYYKRQENPCVACGEYIICVKWSVNENGDTNIDKITITKEKPEKPEKLKKCPIEPEYKRHECEKENEYLMQKRIEQLVRQLYGTDNVEAREQVDKDMGFPDIVVFDSPAHIIAEIIIELKSTNDYPHTVQAIWQLSGYRNTLICSENIRSFLIAPGNPHPYSYKFPEVECINYYDAIKILKSGQKL